MVNQEFQELKRQLLIAKKNEKDIIDEMRANLLKRNGGQELYHLEYTEKSNTYNIKTATVEELYSIDGDMCPQGK
ncbi:MAG: hypothetical protein IJK85_05720 [Bacteroidales bacterium]|nr:hypothetical protein [Bacteroidales bacterium]